MKFFDNKDKKDFLKAERKRRKKDFFEQNKRKWKSSINDEFIENIILVLLLILIIFIAVFIVINKFGNV